MPVLRPFYCEFIEREPLSFNASLDGDDIPWVNRVQ